MVSGFMTFGASPRVLVMGAGSIGTRHIHNLVRLGASVDFVDPSADSTTLLVPYCWR